MAERDGFGGARPSIRDPAVRVWTPGGNEIEINDTWTARILAFFLPFVGFWMLIFLLIFEVIIAFLFCLGCCVQAGANENRHSSPALKRD